MVKKKEFGLLLMTKGKRQKKLLSKKGKKMDSILYGMKMD